MIKSFYGLSDRVLFRILTDKVVFSVFSDMVLFRTLCDRLLFRIICDRVVFRVLLRVPADSVHFKVLSPCFLACRGPTVASTA